MKARLILVTVFALLVGLVIWRGRKQPQPTNVTSPLPSAASSTGAVAAIPAAASTLPAVSATGSASSAATAGTRLSESLTPSPQVAKLPSSAPKASPTTETPPAISPINALENLRTTVRQYGSTFRGNPVGTNVEITRALNGENPKHVKFLDSGDQHINEKGELVDAWSTPYFFHQLAAMEMEIRSAGPDKRMWTTDDLVIR